MKHRDWFEIVFVCLINICGFLTEWVVDDIPDIPLHRERGAQLGKMGGGGGGGASAWQYDNMWDQK